MRLRLGDLSALTILNQRPAWMQHGLAALAVALAAVLTTAVPVIGERAVFLVFFFAILQISLWIGFKPGLFAIVLSVVAINPLFLHAAWVSSPLDIMVLNAGFCLLSGCIVISAKWYRHTTLALWESRKDLAHAQAVGRIGSWRLDVRQNELFWSDENYRIFGIPRNTPLTYEAFLGAVHPEDRAYVDRMWQLALKGEPYDIAHRVIAAGEVKWVRERAELEFDLQGKLLGGFGTSQDITELKQAEQALVESQQRYAGIVESAMDAIISIDANHKIVQFNAAAEQLFGYPATTALGMPIERLIPERFRPQHTAHIDTYASAGVTRRKMGNLSTLVGLRANSEEFPIETSISQTEHSRGNILTIILRDVTERLQTESALREQIALQDQLTKIAATVPGVICSFRLRPDGSTSFPYASPSFEEFYGLEPEAVSSDASPIFSRIHPDDLDHVNTTIAASARMMTPWRDTFRYRHPNKGEIWIEGHSVPQIEANGDILWQGYIHDVTDRKAKEQTLSLLNQIVKHQLEEMQTIFETVPIGLAIAEDANGRHIRGNPANERLLGLSPGAELSLRAQPTPNYRCFHEGQALDVDQLPMQRAVRGERVSGQIMDVERANGQFVTLISHAAPLFDDTGRPRGAVGAFLDITALIRAENECRLGQQRWQQLAETMPHMVWSCTPEGNCDYLGRQWLEYTGQDLTSQLGRGWLEQIHGEDRDRLRGAWKQALATGRPFSMDLRIRRHDGSYRWFKTRADPIRDGSGEIVKWYGSDTDIHDLREIQDFLQASEEFKQAVLDALPASIAVLDRQGVIRSVNRPWMRFAEENGNPGNAHVGVGVDYLEVCRAALENGDRFATEAIKGIETVLGDQQKYFELEYPCDSPTNERWFLMQVVQPPSHIGGAVVIHVDTSERKRADAALRESEELFRAMFELAAVGLTLSDASTGHLLRVNERYCNITGYSEVELLERTFSELTHPEDRQLDWELYSRAVRGETKDYRNEKRYLHKDGRVVWVSVNAAILHDTAGRPNRTVAVVEDISERKRADLALRQAEERLRLALSAGGMAAWDWHIPSGKVVWNDRHYLMLGYQPGSLEPDYRAWANRVHPEDLGHVEKLLRQCMQDQNDYVANFRAVWPDGTVRWLEARGQFVFDEAGQPIRNYGVMLDITPRMLSELALRENATRLSLALEAAGAGLWDRELLSDKTFFSPEWKRQLGYADDELINQWQTWENLLHPDDREQALATTDDFLAQRCSSFDLEYRLRHKDGSYRWIRSRGALLFNQQGHAYRMLGLNLDVTLHKKERDLRDRRGKMEDLFRLYVASQTAAAIAHELNQPLTAIASYAEAALLLLQSSNPNLEKLNQVLENTARQADRAGLVTRQLLALLQKGETITESMDLNATVHEAVELIKSECKESSIQISLDLAADLPPVYASHLQVEKVLINLLRNALQSMQEAGMNAGDIILITRNTGGSEPMAQVTVRDSGKGVDVESLKTIFEPFYTTKATGLGMGLAISRALIEAHGGKLWAERNPDSGLSIHFTLPFTP